jgi:cholinesterase
MPSVWTSSLFAFAFFSTLDRVASRASAPKRRQDVGEPVKTSSGTVVGHAAALRTQVSEYLGIPFAKPPIGNLRFAAPQKFKGNGTINASKYVSWRKLWN